MIYMSSFEFMYWSIEGSMETYKYIRVEFVYLYTKYCKGTVHFWRLNLTRN